MPLDIIPQLLYITKYFDEQDALIHTTSRLLGVWPARPERRRAVYADAHLGHGAGAPG